MTEVQKTVEQENGVEKTPENAAVSGVVATQPNQDVFGEAKTAAHANDRTLSEPDMIAIKEGETVAEYNARVAQIAENRFGLFDSEADENNSNITEYRPEKIAEKTFAGGLSYEEKPLDKSSPLDSLVAFMQAAEMRMTDPDGWKGWVQGEIDKFAGVGAGLNEAKDETKTAVAAGWKALTDGTVAEFLSQPDAINAPLFKIVANAFDAMSKDSNAVNHAFEALGHVVMKASEGYSNLPNYEKGKVIGKVMFGMVNPEGSTEGVDAAMAVSNKLATNVDSAIIKTIEQTLKATEGAASDVAQQTRQMLYDYIKNKGLSVSQLERGGQIPGGFFDNLEKPPEGALVGKGGDWPVLNERSSSDVVRQASEDSCVAAVGEMLSDAALKQADLYNDMVTIPERLSEVLGEGWKGGLVPQGKIEKAFDIFIRNEKPWGAELRDEFYHRVGMGHMVVVDGIDEVGNVIIRDPQHGTRYEMTRPTFMKHWSHRAVFRTKSE